MPTGLFCSSAGIAIQSYGSSYLCWYSINVRNQKVHGAIKIDAYTFISFFKTTLSSFYVNTTIIKLRHNCIISKVCKLRKHNLWRQFHQSSNVTNRGVTYLSKGLEVWVLFTTFVNIMLHECRNVQLFHYSYFPKFLKQIGGCCSCMMSLPLFVHSLGQWGLRQ